MASTDNLTMHAKVYTPFKVYFDGPALSISAKNQLGAFDILPHHRNFITLLEPGDLTVRIPDKNDLKMPISKGVMHVKADEVRVFLDV
jgi:F-type H+-transporting ATPase subunit epsilon